MQRFSHCSCPAAPFGGSHVSPPVLLPTKRKTHPIPIALELGNEEKKKHKQAPSQEPSASPPFFQLGGVQPITTTSTTLE